MVRGDHHGQVIRSFPVIMVSIRAGWVGNNYGHLRGGQGKGRGKSKAEGDEKKLKRNQR